MARTIAPRLSIVFPSGLDMTIPFASELTEFDAAPETERRVDSINGFSGAEPSLAAEMASNAAESSMPRFASRVRNRTRPSSSRPRNVVIEQPIASAASSRVLPSK